MIGSLRTGRRQIAPSSSAKRRSALLLVEAGNCDAGARPEELSCADLLVTLQPVMFETGLTDLGFVLLEISALVALGQVF